MGKVKRSTSSTSAIDLTAKQLERCEADIADGLSAFYKVGKALARIRDERLYKGSYASFDAYCRERWDMAKSNANRLIGASVVVDNLTPIGATLPEAESQARPLTILKTAEEQQTAWQRAVELATERGGNVTAKIVLSAVNELMAPDPKLEAKLDKGAKFNNPFADAYAKSETFAEKSARWEAEGEAKYKESCARIEEESKRRRAESEEIFRQQQEAINAIAEALKLNGAFVGLDQKMAARFVKAGYREMAKECHPDAGGSTEEMAKLNLIKDAIRGLLGIK